MRQEDDQKKGNDNDRKIKIGSPSNIQVTYKAYKRTTRSTRRSILGSDGMTKYDFSLTKLSAF